MPLYIKNLVSGLCLYGGFLLFFLAHPWYGGFANDPARMVIMGLMGTWLGFSIIGLGYRNVYKGEKYCAQPLLALMCIGAWMQGKKPDAEAKLAFMKSLVKAMFLPLMAVWAIQNSANVITVLGLNTSLNWAEFGTALGIVASYAWANWYITLFLVMLSIDTVVFLFAYAVESDLLKNKIKSVEPTLLGWVVAIFCYPPFNNVTNTIFGWHAHEMTFGLDVPWLDIGGKILILALFGWYVFATLSLGFRAGNLVHRGVVRHWAYSVTRHPAYTAKVMAWWLAATPAMHHAADRFFAIPTLGNALGLLAVFGSVLGWSFIYFLRAVTEERHLSADPEYRKYCKKVRWRFVPGLA